MAEEPAITEATIFTAAREITGNKEHRAVDELGVPDAAIRAALIPVIRDLNEIFGSSTSLKEITFTATADEQTYALEDIADDIGEIVFVLRGAAYVPDTAYGVATDIDPRDGLPLTRAGIVDVGFEGAAFDVMVGQLRHRVNSQFSHEVVGGNLILMPCPTYEETILIRYTTAAGGIETLPASAKHALTMAAVVAIFNCLINRVNSDRYRGSQSGVVADERLKMLIRQRDYYQKEYDREYTRLA